MIRSLFTAIGGLKNHQVMMDVTANNIANVNTVGYKSERASFASMLSQTVRGASGPQAGGLGGINPTQVGLGVALQGIQSLLTQGSLQTTGQWNDLAIQGDGYFVVSQTKPAGGAPTDTEFTRAGNFTVDVNGDLVTQGGEYVLGSSMAAAGPPPTFNADLGAINIPVDAQSVAIGADGVVTYDQRGRPADRRPDRDRQVPEPGRPDAPLGQPVRRLAELGRVRSDQPEQRRNPDRGHRELGRPRRERPRRESSRARSRCRTSTSRRSSPR